MLFLVPCICSLSFPLCLRMPNFEISNFLMPIFVGLFSLQPEKKLFGTSRREMDKKVVNGVRYGGGCPPTLLFGVGVNPTPPPGPLPQHPWSTPPKWPVRGLRPPWGGHLGVVRVIILAFLIYLHKNILRTLQEIRQKSGLNILNIGDGSILGFIWFLHHQGGWNRVKHPVSTRLFYAIFL